MIRIGEKAVDFELPDQDGVIVKQTDYRGKWLVLYFYPKDNTSGCSREAGDFTAAKEKFAAAGAEIAGVSPDSPSSHRNFIAKKELAVRLLSDEGKTLIAAYGLWKEKKLYGRTYFGVSRSTVLIDPDGKIAAAWENVKVPGHADKVFETLKKLKG